MNEAQSLLWIPGQFGEALSSLGMISESQLSDALSQNVRIAVERSLPYIEKVARRLARRLMP